MVNPVRYHLDTRDSDRTIDIEPVYEEITGGDLFATGRYLLSEGNTGKGEVRVDGELFDWEWDGAEELGDENIFRIIKFIKEYNEPELADYQD
jgi:hypothetical protein